jgi:gas vesicle protein
MTDPDQIRADIEVTRSNLSDNVNALTDSVKPANVAHRQVDKARGAVVGVKDKVMGASSSATSSAGSTASSVSDAVTGAPGTAKSRTQGNPLAAGLIAFGAGWLLGSALPASSKEVQAAGALKDNASTLAQPLTDAAKSVAAELKEPAQQAVESVKTTAADAASTVKDEGTSSVQDVKDQAQDAKDTVQQARD